MGGLIWCNVLVRVFDVVKGIVASAEQMGGMLGSVFLCV
jgi:hypothetical protein